MSIFGSNSSSQSTPSPTPPPPPAVYSNYGVQQGGRNYRRRQQGGFSSTILGDTGSQGGLASATLLGM